VVHVVDPVQHTVIIVLQLTTPRTAIVAPGAEERCLPIVHVRSGGVNGVTHHLDEVDRLPVPLVFGSPVPELAQAVSLLLATLHDDLRCVPEHLAEKDHHVVPERRKEGGINLY
jgi:hypothetical protein